MDPVCRRLVLIDCDNMLDTILETVSEFAPATMDISVITGCDDLLTTHGECLRNRFGREGLQLTFVKGECTDQAVLQSAGIAECDSVVIGNLQQCSRGAIDDHDATIVATILLIKWIREQAMTDISSQDTPSLHIVGLSGYKDTQLLADVLALSSSVPISVDMLNLDFLMSGWIVQVAAEPEVTLVFRELLASSAGSELYVRKGHLYVQGPNDTAYFREVQYAARRLGQTAIGFIQCESQAVLIGVSADLQVSIHDRVVVMAEA
uniref:Uncharacterized protein n=1 Tax=Tetraselmis sp. GSL018 TaxID=582737 RepID=A0A061RQP4_9CHLO